ncbi:AAA family ATPase [Bacillus bombysepticus]
MGTGPKSSKTAISVAICRALKKLDNSVVPFKSIAVIDSSKYMSSRYPIYSYGIIHHCQAAGIKFNTNFNPVLVNKTSDAQGDIYINGIHYGKVALLNDDMIIFDSLSNSLKNRVLEAIKVSLTIISSQNDYVIIEGASSPVDLNENDDIPNIMVARLTKAPIIISSLFSKGGSAASLIGTLLCLPQDLHQLVKGVILSNVRNLDAAQHTFNLISSYSNKKVLGYIPNLPICWDNNLNNEVHNEQAYDVWANAVMDLTQGPSSIFHSLKMENGDAVE